MTDKKTAKETLLALYSCEDFNEIAEHGCQVGVAQHHLSYKQTTDFYDTFEEEVLNYLRGNQFKGILSELSQNNKGDLQGYKNDVVWSYIETVAGEVIESPECEYLWEGLTEEEA